MMIGSVLKKKFEIQYNPNNFLIDFRFYLDQFILPIIDIFCEYHIDIDSIVIFNLDINNPISNHSKQHLFCHFGLFVLIFYVFIYF